MPHPPVLALGLGVVLLTACGGPGVSTSAQPSETSTPTATGRATPSESPSPSPSPTTRPTATPTATAPAADEPIRAGSEAYVDVAVATGWRTPQAARGVDAPALENPARIRDWLAAMSDADMGGLIGAADSQVLLGDEVEVLEVEGSWARVVVPDQATPLDPRGYPVWIPTAQLTAAPPAAASDMATVVVPSTWLRTEDGAAAIEVSFGTRLPVLGSGSSAVEVALPGGSALWVERQAVALAPAGASALPASASAVIDSARAMVGLPYVWAGTSGFGYDCSGLVYSIYKAHGLLLPRDGGPQATVGSPVEREALEPGDLVFFARGGSVHHVAIYVGAGEVLEAPYIGAAVRVAELSALPYAAEYAGARRVLEGLEP